MARSKTPPRPLREAFRIRMRKKRRTIPSASVCDLSQRSLLGAMNGLRGNDKLRDIGGRRWEPDSPGVSPTQEIAETAANSSSSGATAPGCPPPPHGVPITEFAVEKGASALLIPLCCRRQHFDLSDDTAKKIDIQFYSRSKRL